MSITVPIVFPVAKVARLRLCVMNCKLAVSVPLFLLSEEAHENEIHENNVILGQIFKVVSHKQNTVFSHILKKEKKFNGLQICKI